MKRIIFISLLLLSLHPLYAQNADLILNTNISPDYVNYLNSKLAGCNQTLSHPSSDSVAMKAHAERIFINISLIQCRMDSSLNKGITIIDSIQATNQRLEKFYNSNIKPLNIENSKLFFNGLLELFKDPKYSQVKSDLEEMSKNYKSELSDIGSNSGDLLNYMINKLQQIRDDFNVLRYNEVPFNLALHIYSQGFDKYMNFNQTHFRDIGTIIDLCNESLHSLKLASEQFNSLQNGNTQPAEMIGSLKASMSHFSVGLDSLSHLLTNEPLRMLKIDTSWIFNTKASLSSMTDILNGKTFYTGSENIKIRPVSLIEHSMDNWGTILLDFYRTGNRYSYTFGNLFPAALPASLVDQLKEDMIINTADNEAAMSARMHAIKAMYLNSLALGRGNSSDNLGVAFTQTYLYMVEMNKEIKNFVQYIQAGDFRSGFQFLVLNNTAVTDSISHYYNTACIDQQLLFTVLMITDAQAQPYTLNSSTKFVPVFIPHSAVLNLKTLSNAVVHTVNDLGNDFGSMYHNLDSMFNMSLDPNYLDFSNVKSPLDLILVLQRSNPNFLNITPYGITTFQDTRVTLRNAFSNYAENLNSADHFLDSLAVYRADFNLNGHGIKTVVSEINSFVQEVNTDFQQPDSTTLIHGVKVNLSAWFDNPPQNLLLKLKWFFDNDATTDNSLGGLFPGRNSTNNVQVYPQIPESYSMSQNFPNPFNPSTNITICLPSQSFVSLKVFDVIGREVETLMSQEKPAGTYTVTFDASKLPSGVYFYRLQARQTSGGQAGIFTETKKLILLR